MTYHRIVTWNRLFAAGAALAFVACGGLDDSKPEATGKQSQHLTQSTLPGGTTIEIGIDTPANGAVLPSGPVSVTGTAQIGLNPPVPTDLVLVMDVSGSTVGGAPGCGGDPNNDGLTDSVLDCEIAALHAINSQVSPQPGVPASVDNIGIAFFGAKGTTGDMSPAGGDQLLTAPDADLDGTGGPDVDQVLTHVTIPSAANIGLFTLKTLDPTNTNFRAGLDEAATILNSPHPPGQPPIQRRFVVFISDGINGLPGVGGEMLPSGTIVHTIAAGSTSGCPPLASGGCCAADLGGLGSLQQIADAHGGTCTNVPDIAALPNVAPALIQSKMTAITLTVDSNPTPIDTITPPIPAAGVVGPKAFTWSTTLNGLSHGEHQLCATATGKDGGLDQEGSVTECVTIRINNPPVALCQNLSLQADATCGASGSVNNGSFDPDGDPITCTQTPPGPYNLGATGVTLTCVDPFGASALCTATVNVIDATPPAISCPANQTAECTNGSATVDYGNASASDNCGVASVGCAPPSGSSFPLGKNPVTCTATDTSGNASVCGFNVAVVDTKPPVVTVGGGGDLWPPNHKYVMKTLADCGIQINDQCQGAIDLSSASPTITCVTSDEVENAGGDGNTTEDIVIVNATTVNLRAERSGSLNGRVYKIHFQVKDAAGNVTSGVCPVSVPHDQGGGSVAVDSGVHYSVGSCN